jgi:uncharacterized protein with HEPN domain
VSFLEGITAEQFAASRIHQQAVTKPIETIGEAAARVSERTRAAHSEVPWREIIGMRHRLVHDYFEIDLEKVWDTVRHDRLTLIAALHPLVPPEEA